MCCLPQRKKRHGDGCRKKSANVKYRIRMFSSQMNFKFNFIYVIISHYNYTLSRYLLRQRRFHDTCTRTVHIQNVFLCTRKIATASSNEKRFRSVSFNLNDVQKKPNQTKSKQSSHDDGEIVLKVFPLFVCTNLQSSPTIIMCFSPSTSILVTLTLIVSDGAARWQTFMCV